MKETTVLPVNHGKDQLAGQGEETCGDGDSHLPTTLTSSCWADRAANCAWFDCVEVPRGCGQAD